MQSQWTSVNFNNLTIAWKTITITLRRNFNTAHSSSSTRNNFFIKIIYKNSNKVGCGECGLPPKKPLCYLADAKDCEMFMETFMTFADSFDIKTVDTSLDNIHDKVFKDVPVYLFKIKQNQNKQTFTYLLLILNYLKNHTNCQQKAVKSAFQFAIFDLWSKLLSISMTELIFSSKLANHECSSFYTLSFEQNSQMIANALASVKYTPFIKIKYIDDIDQLFDLFQKLQQCCGSKIIKYIIDANASWSQSSFHKFNERIILPQFKSLINKILYIQQPFPVEMTNQEQTEWAELKKQCPLKIVVDQSFSGIQDIGKACRLGHAVNIKSQKAGGPINCLISAELAKQSKLQVMLGSMVSTHLGATQTYCLHPLTRWLDVDGSLLVESPNLQGGFKWSQGQFLIAPKQKYFGVEIDVSLII